MKNYYLVSHLSSNWHQMKYIIKNRWNKLTDHDIKNINGHKDRLIDVLIDKYKLSQDEAEGEVNLFWH